MVPRLIGTLLVLSLAACTPPQSSDDNDFTSFSMTKPIHVERVRVQYSAAFAPGKSDLPYDEALHLETFLDQAGVRPNDRVFVSSPAGDPLAGAREGRIAALLDHRTVGVVPLSAPPSGVAANHVLIQVDRYVATPPRCPNWSGSPETGHGNQPSSNVGCADATNLAEMIDNPRDLMMGRDMGPADAEPGLNAINRYRTDQVKPFLTSGQQGGSSGGSGQGSSSSGGASPGSGMAAAGASAAASGQ
jgi:pilus assembly protein CpaD